MIRKAYHSSVVSGGGGPTISISDVPVTGGNPLLVVCVSTRAGSITGVTWNGNAFTLGAEVTSAGTYGETASLWYLVPPAPGTYNVVVTVGGTSYKAQAILLNDVAQSSPVNVTGTDISLVTLLDPSLTTTVDNALVIQVGAWIVSNSGSAQLNGITINSGQTLIGENYSGPSGDCMGTLFEVIPTAGSNTFSINANLNGNTAVSVEDAASVIVAFKQSLYNQPNAPFLLNFL